MYSHSDASSSVSIKWACVQPLVTQTQMVVCIKLPEKPQGSEALCSLGGGGSASMTTLMTAILNSVAHEACKIVTPVVRFVSRQPSSIFTCTKSDDWGNQRSISWYVIGNGTLSSRGADIFHSQAETNLHDNQNKLDRFLIGCVRRNCISILWMASYVWDVLTDNIFNIRCCLSYLIAVLIIQIFIENMVRRTYVPSLP